MSRMQRLRLGAYVNYGAHHLSTLAHVSARTAQRWIAADSAPAAVVALLKLVIDGDLALIDASFAGWLLRNGRLRSPCGYAEISTENLNALPFLLQLARELARQQN